MNAKHHAPRWRWWRRAFSLVELLVVIAIIMILTALLLPALSKAKETAKTATCLGNIKQTYLGVAAYAADFNGYAPFYKPWFDTASDAITSSYHVRLASGSTWAYFRAAQMIDNQYWLTGSLRCPERKDWEKIGANTYCFNVPEYYRKKTVYYEGANQALYSSYSLKSCARANWSLGSVAVNDANQNLSYRLGQNPGETLLMDYFTRSRAPNPRHKFTVAYEDGAATSARVKSWTQVTAATGNADAYMDILRKMGRDYAGTKTW